MGSVIGVKSLVITNNLEKKSTQEVSVINLEDLDGTTGDTCRLK